MTATAPTPIRPFLPPELALSDDLRAAIDRAIAVGQAAQSAPYAAHLAEDAVGDAYRGSWRLRLARVAELAIAAGDDAATFALAADTAYYFAKDHTPVPTEPPELRNRTRRQQAIWRYFREKWQRHHLSPTIRDIQGALGISSTSVVAYNLAVLVKAGLLEHDQDRGTAHAYRLNGRWR